MDKDFKEAKARLKNSSSERAKKIQKVLENYKGPEIVGNLKPSLLARLLRLFT